VTLSACNLAINSASWKTCSSLKNRLKSLREWQQFTFVASAIAIGFALIRIMTADQPLSVLPVGNSGKAVEVARTVVPKAEMIRKLNHVDLIKGLDPNRGADMAWSIEFEVDVPPAPRSQDRLPHRRIRDVIVTTDGKTTLVEAPP
jgi:hypothetical protein